MIYKAAANKDMELTELEGKLQKISFPEIWN